jgi:SUKH-3 immunity protein
MPSLPRWASVWMMHWLLGSLQATARGHLWIRLRLFKRQKAMLAQCCKHATPPLFNDLGFLRMHPHRNEYQTDAIPPRLRAWLESFGWKPGVPAESFRKWKYGRSLDTWLEYCELFACRRSNCVLWETHPARVLLQEFKDIKVEPPFPPEAVRYSHSFTFRVDEAIGIADEIRDLSDHVDDFLVPFGLHNEFAHLLIGMTGRVFMSGEGAPGVFFFGETFADAMNVIYEGLPANPVRIEDERFRNLELHGGPDWIFTPPPIVAD